VKPILYGFVAGISVWLFLAWVTDGDLSDGPTWGLVASAFAQVAVMFILWRTEEPPSGL
jgi:hypothetical protein